MCIDSLRQEEEEGLNMRCTKSKSNRVLPRVDGVKEGLKNYISNYIMKFQLEESD